MKHFCLVAALAAFSLPAVAADDELEFAGRIGQFRGYEAANTFVAERLLDQNTPGNQYFALSNYFGGFGLEALLGAYSGNGTSNDFRNGTPNGVNMLLWHLGFNALGQAVAQVCDDADANISPTLPSTVPLVLAPAPLLAFNAVCAAGADSAAQARALEQVWMSVFGYDLPEREMREFVAFFANDAEYLAASSHSQVAMTVNGMFLNPFFLLAR